MESMLSTSITGILFKVAKFTFNLLDVSSILS